MNTDDDIHKVGVDGRRINLMRKGTDNLEPGALWILWLCSVFLQFTAIDSQMGANYNDGFWRAVWSEVGANNEVGNTKRKIIQCGSCVPKLTVRKEVLYRWGMDWLINSLCYKILSVTFPMAFLSSDGLSDFLQNCTAVFFITTLDDLSESSKVNVAHLLEDVTKRAAASNKKDDSDPELTPTNERTLETRVRELEDILTKIQSSTVTERHRAVQPPAESILGQLPTGTFDTRSAMAYQLPPTSTQPPVCGLDTFLHGP